MSMRSLAMRVKEDIVDGPRLVPPVIQWARRAVLERAEDGLLGSFVLLDIFVALVLLMRSCGTICYLFCYYNLEWDRYLWGWLVLFAGFS